MQMCGQCKSACGQRECSHMVEKDDIESVLHSVVFILPPSSSSQNYWVGNNLKQIKNYLIAYVNFLR